MPLDKEEKERFWHPIKDNLLPYNLLDHIEDAANMIEYHIKNNNKIYLVVDCD